MSELYDLANGPRRPHRFHHNGEARYCLELEAMRNADQGRPCAPETDEPANS